MNRRTILRSGAVVAGALVAGCGSDADPDDDDESGSDTASPAGSVTTQAREESTTTGQTPTVPAGGSVRANAVEGFTVVSMTGSPGDGKYVADVTVENTGEQTVNPTDYGYGMRVYDETGATVEEPRSSSRGWSVVSEPLEPGERTTVTLSTDVRGDSSAVYGYEVSVLCTTRSEAYC